MACCYEKLGSAEELQEALDTNEYALVIYSATWCGPCRKLKEWLKEEYEVLPFPVRIADVEELEELSQDIRGLPTLLGFHKGEVFVRMEGFDKVKVKEALEDMIGLANKKDV